MIGRGSRKLPNKSSFKISDLGNNVRRFGYWQDFINWSDAFKFPDRFLESRISELDDLEFEAEYTFPKGFDKIIDTRILDDFNMKECYNECIDEGSKGNVAIDRSIDNHFEAIHQTAQNIDHALNLQKTLQEHIEHRIKKYTKCISKCTDNYVKYLLETYNRKLSQRIRMEIDDNDN